MKSYFKKYLSNPILYGTMACLVIFIITFYWQTNEYKNEFTRNFATIEEDFSRAIIGNEHQIVFKLIAPLKVEVVKNIEVYNSSERILTIPNGIESGQLHFVKLNLLASLSGVKIASIRVNFDLFRMLYQVIFSPVLILSIIIAIVAIFISAYLPLKNYRNEFEIHLSKLRIWASNPNSRLISFSDTKFKDALLSEVIELVESGVKARIDAENSLIESERKKEEIELKGKQNAAIANITQTIAHDIRNPLGMFEFVQNVNTVEEFRELKPKLLRAYLRVQAMVENIRMGNVELIVRPSQVIPEFSNLISEVEPLAKSKGVKLSYFPYEKPLKASLDLPLMERAITNLLRNAIECGAKNVSLSEEVDEDTLILKIFNDGPEIPPEILSKLFNRGVTYGKQGGTGLGLNFVKTVIQGHGGQIVYERLNNLTYFIVTMHKSLLLNNQNDVVNNVPSFAETTEVVDALVQTPEISLSKFLLVAIDDQEISTAIQSAISTDSDVVVSVDKNDLKKASLVYTDKEELMSGALKLGINVMLAQSSEDVNVIIRKLKRKLQIK